MEKSFERTLFNTSLTQLESESFNFAARFIQDGTVRRRYVAQIKEFSEDYRHKVDLGKLTPREAAAEVNDLRNAIMEASRFRSSDIGRARAIRLKGTGRTLRELLESYAGLKYRRPFDQLSVSQQNHVYLEIIEASGRARPSVNVAMARLSRAGRGLLVVTLACAVYNVAASEDMSKAATREGVAIGGGFIGGAVGGAVAGMACGPGAPICVTLGVFVGGALGALGADLSFDWATK